MAWVVVGSRCGNHLDWMRATRALDVVIATTQLRSPSVAA